MTNSANANPLPAPSPVEFGGRVELRLRTTPRAESDPVLFDARWFTADQTIEGTVEVSTPGPLVRVLAPNTLPEWLSAFTNQLVRTTARNALLLDSWPRRLTRWRKAPESPAEI